MRTSMKLSIISISILLFMCFGIYRSYANIGTEAEALNAIDGCICGRIYQPVCASDMQTYANRCLFECARKKLVKMGRSLALLRSGVCAPGQEEGVGRGEKSIDEVELEAAAFAEEDKDLLKCKCDRSFKQVCGSDNRTYNNRCLFDCKRSILARSSKVLRLLHEGACN